MSKPKRSRSIWALCAALAIPLATESSTLRFTPDGYWRGETHRVCTRPGALIRVLDELGSLDIEQVVLVTAAPDPALAHELSPPCLDGRARLGEYLLSAESSVVRDAVALSGVSGPRVFTIRPSHNPIGPFDFRGQFDDRSDRVQSLDELMSRGYSDAYYQFIEPVLGASGELVGDPSRRPTSSHKR